MPRTTVLLVSLLAATVVQADVQMSDSAVFRGDLSSANVTFSQVVVNPANGHSYEFVRLSTAISWHDALSMAESAGGYLATITDASEAAIVTTLLSNSSDEAWLGASDEAQEGTWVWANGEPWDYTNWYPGEPNAASPDQDYLLCQHVLGGRWVDVEDNNDGLIIETGEVNPNPNVIINPVNGHKYEFVRLDNAISWHDAVTMAENAGGYLATVTDSVEARIVTTLLSGPGDEAWLGASDEAQEGAWTWITGEPWGYTNWYPGEPNAGRDTEDYLLATSGLGGRWVDVWDNNYGLIIESERQTLEQPTLVSPVGDNLTLYDMLSTFTWTDAAANVTYKLQLSVDPDFSFVKSIDDITDTEYQLTDSLDFGMHYWWRVIATDQGGNFSVSDTADFWTWTLGDVNSSHDVTLGDVMVLVDHLFISHTPIEPPMAGDMNGDCKITLGDIMWLVADLFISKVELRVGCE